MRAKEFIHETKSPEGKISNRVQQATVGLNTYSDGERWNGDYVAYRLGMAVASGDGKDIKPNMDAKSWIGKNKTAHPYTKEEQAMLKDAYAAVGASFEDLNDGDLRSQEVETVNKSSPVTAFKGYKRK
jgi:hypothetical protein